MADGSDDQPKMFPLFAKSSQKGNSKPTKESENERKRKYEKESRKRYFQSSWTKEFEWLEHDEKNNIMYCKICKKHDSFGTFVSGSSFFRKDSIKAHEESQSHKHNTLKEKAQTTSIEKSTAMKSLATLNIKTINQLKHKFRNVHYIAKKCRPYTDYVDLCNLSKAQGLDIGSTYLTNKAASEFLQYIAESARNNIRKSINESKFLSVISDGSTDASYQEAEIVYVRTCNKGKIQVYFSLVQNVPRGNAETICKVMQDGMENLAKDFRDKLVATGTDGASAMLGAKSGAVQRLREAVDRPYIVGIHCNGHKLELSFKDSIKEKLNLYNKVELFLTNLYYFYRNSNVTRSGLKETSKATGQKMVFPTRVSGTRWVGHLKIAIENFLKGYNLFVTHLGQMQNRDVSVSRTDQGNKAKGLYACAQTKSVWLMLHFLVDVLEILSSVSKKFQSETACISEVLTEIETAVASLEKMKERNGLKLRRALESVPEQLTGDDRSFVSARQKLLAAIIKSLQNRFTDKPGIMAAVSTFNLSLFPSDIEDIKDYGDDEVDQLVDQFCGALEVAGVEVNQIAHEWTKLKQLMPTRFTDPVNNLTWVDVNSRLGKVCPNILALVDLVLTIPASSADAERGFSYLKNTKTESRNKLLDKNLSNQLMVVLETGSVGDFDPTEAVHLWNAAVTRRPRQELSEQTTIEPTASSLESETGNKTTDTQMTVTLERDTDQQSTQDTRSTTTHTQITVELEINNNNEEMKTTHEENVNIEQEEPLCKPSLQDKLVGCDIPIPSFSSQATQTYFEPVVNEGLEDNYTSDCDFYEKEWDEVLFEKHIQYEERVELARKAYKEFLLACEGD